MTSYGGIIRIRLRVEVGLLPLSLQTQAPLYLLLLNNIHSFPRKHKLFSKIAKKHKLNFEAKEAACLVYPFAGLFCASIFSFSSVK